MSGDQAPDDHERSSADPSPATESHAQRPDPGVRRGGRGNRPGFLPPAGGHAEAGRPATPAPPDEPGGPGGPAPVWNVAVILAAAILLVAAFLPWAQAQIAVNVFGRTLTRDLGSVIGIEADGVVAAVPVLALVAAGMAFWGIFGRDDRISALGAVPGALSLAVCGLFVLRLDDLKEHLDTENIRVGYQVAVVYGWYLAVAMSLLVIAFSLARPVAARLARALRPKEPERPGEPEPSEPDAS